jgi:hypothetical protein
VRRARSDELPATLRRFIKAYAGKSAMWRGAKRVFQARPNGNSFYSGRSIMMKMTEGSRAILIVVFVFAGLTGTLFFLNGLFMLVAPLAWYGFIPGVSDTGFFNQHFIRDIGIIQLFVGAAFGIGMIRPDRRIELWAGATLWLAAHAVFHLWEVAVGICSPSVIPRDFPAVTLPAIIGVVLTLWAIHDSRAGRASYA